jgi:2-polyprenyl-6-methoxyphenol hydroxylase-like FAD-dependent oxidoreductase
VAESTIPVPAPDGARSEARADAETDVLIAGAGPVGLVLAIDLARRGIAVHIVDTLPAPTTESRAIVVHSRSLDHIEMLGVLPDLLDRSRVARGMAMHDGDTTVAEVSFEGIRAVHPFSAAIAQTDTEALLGERLQGLGVTVERSTALSGFDQDADGVDAELTGADGRTRRLRARYLVGADGARSTVRHGMGQRLEGSFAGEDFLLGDVEGEHHYDGSQFHTFFSPGTGTGLLFPLLGERVRVFAQLAPGTDPDRPVSVEWLQQALDERGIRLRIHEAHWLTRITLKHGQVPRYRDGRVFLAGDAAHIHSPAGGLGMNTGIQDATNLGWKLAQAVRGGDTAGLLDSYHLERHPVAADVISFTTRLSAAGTVSNPVAQRARNVLMHLGLSIPAVAQTMVDRVEQQNVAYPHSPIVGGRGGVLKPGDYLRLDDTVVAQALAEHPGHLAILVAGRDREPPVPLPDWIEELAITDGDAAALRRSAGLPHGGLVIVRPDGYVGHIDADAAAGLRTYARLIGVAGHDAT